MIKKIFSFVQKFYLQFFLLFLVLLFFIFSPKNEKAFKSALLNPKYKVDEILFSEKNQKELVLKNVGSFWFGQEKMPDGKNLSFICDSVLVDSFIKSLKDLIYVYEISNKKNYEAYGLQDDKSFLLCLKGDGKVLSTIRFGSVDSMKRIFFSVPSRKKIFSVDSDFLAPYLSTNVNFWANPEIFPKVVVGADKKYRRGKLALSPSGEVLLSEDFNWSDAIVKTYDSQDGNIYKAFFLDTLNGDYYYRLEVEPSVQRPKEEKDALKKINSVFMVSAWTFERVLNQE